MIRFKVVALFNTIYKKIFFRERWNKQTELCVYT